MFNEFSKIDAYFSETIFDFQWRVSRKAVLGLIREAVVDVIHEEDGQAENYFITEELYAAAENKNIYALNNPRFDQNDQVDPWLTDFLPAYASKFGKVSLISRSSKNFSVCNDIIKAPSKGFWKISFAILFVMVQLIFILAILLALFQFEKIPKKGLLKNLVSSTFSFFSDFANYSYLFYKLRNSVLVLTDAYSKPGVVACARFFSIYVVELQHGLITRNLPHYHFPHHDLKCTMPNEVRLFSEKWKNASRFAKGQRIGFYDAKLFSRFSGIDVSLRNNNSTIVILMQKSDQKTILDDLHLIYKYFSKQDVRTVLRLHPRQLVDDFQYLKKSMKSLEILSADSMINIGPKTVFIVGNSFGAFQLASAGFTVCIKDILLQKHSFFADNSEVFVGYTSVEQLFEKIDIFANNFDNRIEYSCSKFFDGSVSQPSVISD